MEKLDDIAAKNFENKYDITKRSEKNYEGLKAESHNKLVNIANSVLNTPKSKYFHKHSNLHSRLDVFKKLYKVKPDSLTMDVNGSRLNTEPKV